MLNQVSLIGHLGRDPETRTMPSGDKVASISLATSERWKDKTTGERKERTEWHRITIFNQNLVRIIEQYTRKGSRLFVQGALRTRKYTDQSGVERYSTEIVLENFNGTVTLLDAAGERSGPSQDDYGTTRTREGSDDRRPSGGGTGAGSTGGRPNYDLDDDIPF